MWPQAAYTLNDSFHVHGYNCAHILCQLCTEDKETLKHDNTKHNKFHRNRRIVAVLVQNKRHCCSLSGKTFCVLHLPITADGSFVLSYSKTPSVYVLSLG